ncbi:hypothetical protein [Hespellia stercorisuis]|uniref:Uncharacterized protein n=1 Tax=Hespellia stercorisuis DSM 15480 TaxID=1121950 RepID=A0A1M6SRU9_9FIRM|nr:hypothetical protein [Hespellia stercorisuis]SHK47464.1 hypothetical protein SAMN02745243_03020 [Hespellia stercorisuis DSM 15480]
MKKTKRILALIGALLLAGMYISTLIFAFIGSPAAVDLLKISVACTIFLPVLLYACSLVYRLSRKDKDDDSSAQ